MSDSNAVYRTGNVDPLWGEAVVIRARNDGGQEGWMVCRERDDPSRGGVRYYPKFWYPLSQWEWASEGARDLED